MLFQLMHLISQIMLCFNWKNIRPLYYADNIRKHDLIDMDAIKKHRIEVEKFVALNKINENVAEYFDMCDCVIKKHLESKAKRNTTKLRENP